MKQSKLFTKTQKEAPKGEVSKNAQLLVRAGYADKLMAGVYTLLPLGLAVYKKIENIIREEMNAIGGQEFFMPTLHPKENWEITGRWSSLNEDIYKTGDNEEKKYVLAPTHEEVIVPLVKKFVSSYKDLPFSAYQFQNKFRREKRAKSGLIRGREFMMKDLYSFHLSEQNLDEFYKKVEDAYSKIFDRAGIGEKTYKTFASGASFSKYSHEYQTVTSAGEDVIYICDKCKIAVNQEIIKEVEGKCPECKEKLEKTEKSVEVGNIFKNKDKYTKPFDLKVKNEKGEDVILVTGCYGIGLQRLMGTIVEVSNDEKGIIWPESIAPFSVHLLSLNQNQKADEIYEYFTKKGVEILYDDRDMSAGEKFADADLIGIPYQMIVSEKNIKENKLEIKNRKTGKAEYMKFDLEEVAKKFSRMSA